MRVYDDRNCYAVRCSFGGKFQNVKCPTIIIITIIIIMKLLCIVGFACLLFKFHDLFIIRDVSFVTATLYAVRCSSVGKRQNRKITNYYYYYHYYY